MCRLAAYLGPRILLHQFLLAPLHGLVKQSWASQEMDEAVLNADGFGIGWYTDNDLPATYRNTLPIWSDINLPDLGNTISSSLWLGYVRSATPGQANGLNNTQPFVSGNLQYVHNGYIKDFIPKLKQRIIEHLQPDILAGINGNTDSEYLFAIIRQAIQQNQPQSPDLDTSLLESVGLIKKIIANDSALLNFIISDGKKLYAIRHAINAKCPSLYYDRENPEYPGSGLVASEPLNSEGNWQSIPENHLLTITNNLDFDLVAL